ncbi:MAG: serine/threonine protein kinase, partial [Blastocatellia bacterium]
MLKKGAVLQTRYRILDTLTDKGGMGVVYLATDLEMENTVVIKQSIINDVESLRQNKNYRRMADEELRDIVEASRKAFEREAKLLYGLRHNALPRVSHYFAGTDGEQFFVMDYVRGDDLSELLNDRLRQNQGPFPCKTVLDWADQVLDALHYLHTAFGEPIVHRDIKPANLKLTPKGQIVLLDFGLAKGVRPGMAAAESILAGTEEYAPIEQLDEDENARQKSDPRSDLYSLAITLHHLLSGQLPAKTISRVSAKAQNTPDPLRPIHELVPEVRESVSAVLQRAGAVFAKDRLKTAAEMRQLLREAVASTPPVITSHSEPEMETVVRHKRNIVVSLVDEAPKPVAEIEEYAPKPATQTRQQSGWLKNLLGSVTSSL